MARVLAGLLFAALIALGCAALPLRRMQQQLSQQQQSRDGAWVEAELTDAVALDLDESAGDAVEADTVAEAEARTGAAVPKMVTVTVAGTAISVACQVTVDDSATNTIDAVWLAPLRSCAPLKNALHVVDDLPPLNSVQWVTQVVRTNPTNWEAFKSASKTTLKVVWNWTAGWVADAYDYPNGAAAFNAGITAGIKAADVVEVRMAALAVVSGVMTPTPAAPNNVARSCYVAPQASNPTLTDAVVDACVGVLRGRDAAAPAGVVYTFTYADTTARAPATALNGAINGAVSITIGEPAPVDVLRNRDGHAQATVHTWIRRSLATTWNDEFVAAVNAHANMAGAVAINGAGDTKNAVCAGTANAGGPANNPAVTYNAANTLDAAHLTQVEYWPELTAGVIPNAWFPVTVVGDTPAVAIALYPPNAAVNIDNIKVNVAGGGGPASQEVFYLNAVAGDMTSAAAAGAHQAAARLAAEAAFVTAGTVGGAGHTLTPVGVWDRLREFGPVAGVVGNRNRALPNGPARTLKRALQAAAHAHTAASTHFGFGYFEVRVRLQPRTLRYAGTGDMLPTKVIGWLGFSDNHVLGQGPVGPHNEKGAGMHTEQRIAEQFRRFVLGVEQQIGGGNGHRFRVVTVKSRWITEYDPDDDGLNNCKWMLTYTRIAALRGYFRTAIYDEVVRQHGAGGGGVLWNTAATQAALGPLVAADVIAWTDPIDHYIYERGWAAVGAPANLRQPFPRRTEAYRLTILAGNAVSVPDAARETTWGNPDGTGNGVLVDSANYFALP